MPTVLQPREHRDTGAEVHGPEGSEHPWTGHTKEQLWEGMLAPSPEQAVCVYFIIIITFSLACLLAHSGPQMVLRWLCRTKLPPIRISTVTALGEGVL